MLNPLLPSATFDNSRALSRSIEAFGLLVTAEAQASFVFGHPSTLRPVRNTAAKYFLSSFRSLIFSGSMPSSGPAPRLCAADLSSFHFQWSGLYRSLHPFQNGDRPTAAG